MNQIISVREYARLTTQACERTLDQANISSSAFDYLCQMNADLGRGGASLVQVEGRQWLRLDNYVGVVQTPCGTTLEVLPKNYEQGDSLDISRKLLRKMIQTLLGLSHREVGQAKLERFDAPLTEWVMRQFLLELEHVLKKGLRFEYLHVEEKLPFLRGQLNTVAQLRQPPGQAHHFQVRHDVFLPDRPENRLLKLAVDRVRRATADPDNWRLANELTVRMAEVRVSTQVREDLKAWGLDRLMGHYKSVRPWCELILSRAMPIAVAGSTQGMSLLFPMERLFEHYVARWLRDKIPQDARLKTQASGKALCVHEGRPAFELRPDLMVSRGDSHWILDTKWKRIDAAKSDKNYDLNGADFYQMLAYGERYMGGRGQMALIYPFSATFHEPLAPFAFGPNLSLHVLPFDLDREELIGWEVLGMSCESIEAETTAT